MAQRNTRREEASRARSCSGFAEVYPKDAEMNGDEFYALFKHALSFLGLSWGEMRSMEVTASTDQITFEHEGLKITVAMKEEE